MKKYLFTALAALGTYCISCNQPAGPSPAIQKNRDAMHAVGKAFETKDFSKIADVIAEDMVDHAGEKGDIKGLAAIKAQFEQWATQTENDKTEVIKELFDDEYGMAWQHYTGTVKVAHMGMKVGDKYDMKALEVVKFKDGKAVEHWTFMEPGELMKMMSSMQPQTLIPAIDSTKKDSARTKM